MPRSAKINFTFRAFAEDRPGLTWQRHFNSLWPGYKRWFLRFGEAERPTYLESLRALKQHMPEFVDSYEAMVDLSGGGDHAARFLAQYCPPPLFRGCSQVAYHADESVLVRSYDYSPFVFDGLLMRSKFNQREVIGMLDCMSGLLEGINSDGLAVSMSFGGREDFGRGFSVTLVIRYLLEFAGDVAEACDLVRRIPIQGAYNLMLLDRAGKFETVAITPGREPEFIGSRVATNHQADSHWPLYEEKVQTHERHEYLSRIAEAGQHSAYQMTREFLQPPLYHRRFARGFGTLYDAAFYPGRIACEYYWPENSWYYDFSTYFANEYHVTFVDPEGKPPETEAYSEIYTGKPVPVLQF